MKKRRDKDVASVETPGLVWLSDMRRDTEAEEGFRHIAGKPLLFVICAVVLMAALAVIGHAVLSYRSARGEYTRIRDTHVRFAEDPPAGGTQSDAPPVRPAGANLEIDFDALLQVNADTVAWLDLPALDISYPVVWTRDGAYYLSHTFEGESNARGAIFVEPTNRPDFSDCNTFVFGHNSADGSMFGRLHELTALDAAFEKAPFFFIYRADGSVLRYRIYSYYAVPEDSDSFVTFDGDYYDTYVALTKSRALSEIDADFSNHGNIVTLSTCYGGPGTTKRYLVHGVEEPD